MPPSRPDRQTGGWEGRRRREKDRGDRESERKRREKTKRERRGQRERMEPFSKPTGVGSVLTVIELKHQLVMRPPCPEVMSALEECCPTIAHPPTVCFGCLPGLIGLITD